ncbi:Peroxidasin-Like Protein [Manis pentadactyla]|nr:Peroxidasin-Like Protein [Manis pentadactyla]
MHESDQGAYQCVVRNSSGEEKTRKARPRYSTPPASEKQCSLQDKFHCSNLESPRHFSLIASSCGCMIHRHVPTVRMRFHHVRGPGPHV